MFFGEVKTENTCPGHWQTTDSQTSNALLWHTITKGKKRRETKRHKHTQNNFPRKFYQTGKRRDHSPILFPNYRPTYLYHVGRQTPYKFIHTHTPLISLKPTVVMESRYWSSKELLIWWVIIMGFGHSLSKLRMRICTPSTMITVKSRKDSPDIQKTTSAAY